ncbi:MAG: CPBP family intramembrane metalloprotease [Candidatus Thermoplasmatota archaeon]|nr:CPBP family intramembrane metalloprotease [Candidatus Thermoplasmatota archaeon]MBU1940772.1 CPBP family intramembrane metalloprotease [Candidatus Thermoplasmatota archaeon]
MLIPLILPIVYCIRWKKQSLPSLGIITLTMILIVILYWPLLQTTILGNHTYIIVKTLLFIILPLLLLIGIEYKKKKLTLSDLGIAKHGWHQSILSALIFLPLMLLATFSIYIITNTHITSDLFYGIESFFEAFTEEFFFRGILFLFLAKKTTLKIAYLTSLTCFILSHPQHITSLYLLTTTIQGILTLEICRRSKNLFGAWILHGTNRFFTIVILPLIIFL